MPGPLNPLLRLPDFHGFKSGTGGRKPTVASRGRAASGALRPQVDLGSTAAGRPRARAASGQTYRRGPAAGVKPSASAPGAAPTIHGQLKPGATVRVVRGQGAAAHVETAKVTSVQVTGATTTVTLATSSGRRTVRVNQQRRVLKDTMTATEDLGHDGQSPVTIMQGGRTLARCPHCGFRLSMDGHCPKHGVVAKALRTGGATLRKDFNQTYIPSTGEARAPTTTEPSGRKAKKPPTNQPVGAPECPDCGGTDGYHLPNCPRNLLNPGGGPAGLGAS